ncbi:MAG: CysS/YqeB C-terminal domain-containing protein, partial [Actinomycetes bacterium]
VDGADPLAIEQTLRRVADARFVFAGPGSPTYALRQWAGTRIPELLADKLRAGGCVTFASAAALTLGSHTVPVYEIYKVGAEPEWAGGLDLLGQLTGISAAVIPHFDNAEGGTHDTRFCYLGEDRLSRLEHLLPDEVGVLGVDEHTAVVVDLEAATVRVVGNGLMTIRRRGATSTFEGGEQLTLADLAAMLRGDVAPSAATASGATPPSARDAPREPVDKPATSLRSEADDARSAFEEALTRRDVEGCVSAVLRLEAAVAAWRADTLQSDDMDEARRVLRALVVRLGELAVEGVRDPREQLAPYVELLLEVRATARNKRDFATSDMVRDRLTAIGVEVHDTPEGTTWDVAGV